MLTQRITDDMKAAMKDKDTVALSAIRMLRAAMKDKEIELKSTGLNDEQTFAVIARMIKQRKDSSSQYEEAGRPELAAKENAEISVLEVYLPAQITDEEIAILVAKAVAECGATSMKDMGQVMALVRPQTQGKADMGKVSAAVKASLL